MTEAIAWGSFAHATKRKRTMEPINADRASLIAALEENLAAHTEEFKDAFAGWERLAGEWLRDVFDQWGEGERPKLTCPHVPPVSHAGDYRRAIGMLKMSVDTTVRLHEDEFMRFVMDDWEWSRAWRASNTSYLVT